MGNLNKAIIAEITGLAIDIQNAGIGTVFVNLSGHVSVIGVRVYLGDEPDWSNLDRDPDLNMDVYLNGENRYSATQITQAIKQLTALLTPANA